MNNTKAYYMIKLFAHLHPVPFLGQLGPQGLVLPHGVLVVVAVRLDRLRVLLGNFRFVDITEMFPLPLGTILFL